MGLAFSVVGVSNLIGTPVFGALLGSGGGHPANDSDSNSNSTNASLVWWKALVFAGVSAPVLSPVQFCFHFYPYPLGGAPPSLPSTSPALPYLHLSTALATRVLFPSYLSYFLHSSPRPCTHSFAQFVSPCPRPRSPCLVFIFARVPPTWASSDLCAIRARSSPPNSPSFLSHRSPLLFQSPYAPLPVHFPPHRCTPPPAFPCPASVSSPSSLPSLFLFLSASSCPVPSSRPIPFPASSHPAPY